MMNHYRPTTTRGVVVAVGVGAAVVVVVDVAATERYDE